MNLKSLFLSCVLIFLLVASSIACPPPKFKVGELVELPNASRLYVTTKKAHGDIWHYGLHYLVDGKPPVVTEVEKNLKPVK